jgi:hypothetical protein
MYDTHFHVWFLGWLPRAWANGYLKLLGRHKDYATAPDFQNIQEMHYFMFTDFEALAWSCGFKTVDIRALKLNKIFSEPVRHLSRHAYPLARNFYFSTFHFLLTKPIHDSH